MGADRVESPARVYTGLDRGFVYFEYEPARPWIGLTALEEQEAEYRVEEYYVDGRKVGHRHVAGNYEAAAASYDNPFSDTLLPGQLFGITYRETFNQNGEEHYRLHIVHALSVVQKGYSRSTVNATENPETFSWTLSAIDIPLSDEVRGSHLILDSTLIFPWVLRDIEAVLYGYPDGDARIPSIDELYEIFATMNLVIIDHGDGTWSAVGHDTMVAMLDATEFMISSPSVEIIEDEEHTYEVESFIRDERWLE